MTQQITGYREALRELGRIDKNLQKQYKKDARRILEPGVQAIRSAYPAQAPLSGLARSWVDKGRKMAPWAAGRVRTSVRAAVYTRKTARTSLAIVIGSPIAAVVEFAGKQTDNQLGENLTEQIGLPGRIAWPAFAKQEGALRSGVILATADMTRLINQRLAK